MLYVDNQDLKSTYDKIERVFGYKKSKTDLNNVIKFYPHRNLITEDMFNDAKLPFLKLIFRDVPSEKSVVSRPLIMVELIFGNMSSHSSEEIIKEIQLKIVGIKGGKVVQHKEFHYVLLAEPSLKSDILNVLQNQRIATFTIRKDPIEIINNDHVHAFLFEIMSQTKTDRTYGGTRSRRSPRHSRSRRSGRTRRASRKGQRRRRSRP